jgi:hypothetical protein
LKSARPSSIINEWTLLPWYMSQPSINRGEELPGVTRQFSGPLPDAQCISCHDISRGNLRKAAIEQQIRNTGLLLDPVRKRYIGRVDHTIVDDHIGTRGEHNLDIGRVAAPR